MANNFYLSDLNSLAECGAFDFNFFLKNPQTNQVDISEEALGQMLKVMDKKNNQVLKKEDYKVNVNDMKKRILAVNPNFPQNELNLFAQGKTEISYKEFYDLLSQNELKSDVDPMQEALNLFLDNQGNLDFQKIKKLSQQLGYNEFTAKDVNILQECLDFDKDGKISSKDFQKIFNYLEKQQQLKYQQEGIDDEEDDEIENLQS